MSTPGYAPGYYDPQTGAYMGPISQPTTASRGFFSGLFPWLLLMAIVIGIMFLIVVANLVGIYIILSWTEIHNETSGKCKDGDQCTNSIYINGGCQDNRQPNGHKCVSECYYPETEISTLKHHECQLQEYDSLTGLYNSKSVCVGSSCKGDCDITSNCPNITFRDIVGASSEKTCSSYSCYYRLNVTGLNDDVSTPCTADSPVYNQICENKLNLSDPIVSDNCLDWTPVCECCNSSDPVVPRLLFCDYFFRCASPYEETFVFPVVRDEPATPETVKRYENVPSARENLNQLLDGLNKERDEEKNDIIKPSLKNRAHIWDKRMQ